MKALIVGGGVAGPAAALALQQVGVDAVVLESRTRSAMDAGSYLGVAPNGLDALDAVGCLDLVRELGMPARRSLMLGATGRELGSVTLGTPLADGTPALTMKRPQLSRGLIEEAVRRGIDVRFDARVASVTTTTDGATATLESGARLVGDFVVGADGVHSRVRRAIDPNAPVGRYVGLTNFGGITRSTPLAAPLPQETWTFVFGRRAFFGAFPTPDGDVVWFVNLPRTEISRTERSTTTDTHWQEILVDALRDDAGPGRELVASGSLELAGDNTYDLGHVPRWHRSRLVVIGDAAHAPSPSSGQGASLALEDSVALAAALGRADTVEQGFTAFEHARRERVERVVKAGARSSRSKTAGPVARVFQDLVLRLVFRHVVTDKSQEWVTGHRVPRDSVTSR